MGLSSHAITDSCRKRAKHYDISANLYSLIGFACLAIGEAPGMRGVLTDPKEKT